MIRPIEEHDLPQLLDWRNELRKYFREYRVLSYVDQARWYEAIQGDPTQTMFAIADKSELLGACGLMNIDWKNGSAEVSIYVGEGYIDGTIAPAALKELMAYAFDELGLYRLWAEVFDYDSDKAVLFQNASFLCEGILKQTYFKMGKYHDSEIYGYLEPAWRSA